MKNPLATAIAAVFLPLAVCASDAQPSASPGADRTQTRRAEAVSKPVYDRILKAQEAAQSEDYATAIATLRTLLANDHLSDYERSIVYQNLGYAHNAAGDTKSAVQAFEEVLRIPGLEQRTAMQMHYILAQLGVVIEQYGTALRHIDSWFELETSPRPDAFMLRAQILYHLERHREMVEPIETALAVADVLGIEAEENWYALLAFGYFQQENYAGIRDVNKILLERWPKKSYWLNLANAFRELGDETNLLVAYDVLYLQGLLRTESELVTLAQLYMQYDLPFEAGIVLSAAIDDGIVARTAGNLRLLSQAWSLAHENERAIAPLEAAAAMHEDGELYVRLANTHLSLGRHRDCADAAQNGIDKGLARNPDHAELTLGICLYHLADYQEARRAFRTAAAVTRSATTAWQWIRTIDADVKRLQIIEEAEALAAEKRATLTRRRDL